MMNRRAALAFLSGSLAAVLDLGRGHAQPVAHGVAAAERRLFERIFTAIDAGKWNDAHAIAAGGSDALARRYVQWADFIRPSGGHSHSAIAEFTRNHSQWPLPDTLRRRIEESLQASRDDDAVLAWFRDSKPLTSGGMVRLAEALHRTGARERARSLAKEIWRTQSVPSQSDFLAQFGAVLTADDHVARVDHLLWEKLTGEAQAMLPRLDAGQRAVAEVRIKKIRGSRDAEAAYKKVADRVAREPGLAYERIRILRRKGDHDDALALLRQAVRAGGRADILWRECDYYARRLMREGKPRDAYALVAEHRIPPEQAAVFVDAEFLAGFIALRRLEDPKRAAEHFKRIHDVSRFPVTLSRAAYWLARAAEATGDAASQETWLKRAALYPVTYYGQLATLTLPAATRPEAVLPALPQAMPRNDLHRMARIMTALGRDDQLRHFIRRAADVAETPEEHRAASRLAIELGRPDLAVSASKRSAQRAGVMLPDEGWPVIDVPREPVLETALVLATIRQESAFEADAVSPAGARGLMQLMPKTARSVAAELGIAKTHRVEKLTRDPDYNMRLGKQYLAGLVSDYGSYLIALSAYNAGPGRASQWIRENGDPRGGTVDPIDWVELIGIAETRNYVQRVMENLQVYRSKTDRTAWLVAMERDFARSRR